MAKLKDLAGLAALGMLGYKLSQKNKDDAGKLADSSSYAPSSNMTPMKGVGDATNDVATDNTSAGVLKAITAPKAVPNDQASNQGVIAPKSLTPAAKSKAKSPVGSGAPPASAKNPNYSNEGRNSSTAAKNPNYSNEGRSSVKPTPPAATKPLVSTPAKSSGRVPTSEEAAANRQALYDKVTSGVGGYLSDTFTLEGRERAKKAASGMKRGGAVKKMASGGMTSKVSSASRRADGIASRGKTRCKMY